MSTLQLSKTILAEDHHINEYGNLRKLPNDSKALYIKFLSGSGSGDQSYWCSFNTAYEVYKPSNSILEFGYNFKEKITKGKLILIGKIHEFSGTDGCGFTAEIEGQDPFKMEGFVAPNLFRQIFQNEK